MQNTVQNLYFPEIPKLAKVFFTESGIAKVVLSQGANLKIYAQAAHIGALQPNDEVLFIDTESGAYIIARSLRGNERPQFNLGNANIFVSEAGDIHLQTAKAQLVITAAGEIQMSAIEIKQQAQQDLHLSAKRHIHLN